MDLGSVVGFVSPVDRAWHAAYVGAFGHTPYAVQYAADVGLVGLMGFRATVWAVQYAAE